MSKGEKIMAMRPSTSSPSRSGVVYEVGGQRVHCQPGLRIAQLDALKREAVERVGEHGVARRDR